MPAHTTNFDPAVLSQLPKEYLEEDIGHHIIGIASTFLILQTTFVLLFYAARHTNKTLNGWECWVFMPVGYIFTTLVCVCGILIVKFGGAGRHVEAVLLEDPNMVMNRNKIDKAMEYIDFAAITGSKLAILCLYLRIFSSRPYRIMTKIVGVIIILNWTVAFIMAWTICKPYAYQWDRTIPGGHCGDIIKAYQFIVVPNVITDFMMLVLPLPAIYKLHVNLGTKVGLFATFLVGSAGTITSILRLVSFMNAAEFFRDPTFKCTATFSYVIAEAGTYLIAACMPSLRPLKRRVFPEHSFTKLIDSSLKIFSSKSSKSFSFGSMSKGGVTRTTDIQLEVQNRKSQDIETGSTAKLHDVGYFVFKEPRPCLPSSTTSREAL